MVSPPAAVCGGRGARPTPGRRVRLSVSLCSPIPFPRSLISSNADSLAIFGLFILQLSWQEHSPETTPIPLHPLDMQLSDGGVSARCPPSSPFPSYGPATLTATRGPACRRRAGFNALLQAWHVA